MGVLVTGGAGYIGSHMVLELLARGEDVVVLDNLTTGYREAVPAGVSFVEGDVSDALTVRSIIEAHDVDAIIHFAGSIVVPESVENPLKYYDNNTARSRSLIATAVECGVEHFIFSSTAAVYGLPPENPVSEVTPVGPISPYGTSKLMTEQMLADVANAHALRFVALRYFNVAGADPQGRIGQSSPTATHLIKMACQAALGQRSHLAVFGDDYDTPDGTGVRDFIHVTDLVAAHGLALDYLRAGGTSDIMNCGYGEGYSVLEVADAVKRASGVDFQVRREPRRTGDIPSMIARADKIKAKLNWVPSWNDLDAMVGHAFAWEAKLDHERAVAQPAVEAAE